MAKTTFEQKQIHSFTVNKRSKTGFEGNIIEMIQRKSRSRLIRPDKIWIEEKNLPKLIKLLQKYQNE